MVCITDDVTKAEGNIVPNVVYLVFTEEEK